MSCYSPTTVWSKTGGRSWGVPCGKCVECLQTKRNQWVFRLKQELKVSTGANFITLTYNPEFLPYTIDGVKIFRKSEINNQPQSDLWKPIKETLSTEDLKRFLYRLRTNLTRTVAIDNQHRESRNLSLLDTPTLKYYAVGEYGTKYDRPHYHLILFNLPLEYKYLIKRSWEPYGFIHVGKAEGASLSYTAAYLINSVDGNYEDRQKPFSRSSNYIGINYVERTKKWHLANKTRYCVDNGTKQPLPDYYKRKIFTSKRQNDLYAQEAVKASNKRETERHDKIRKSGDNPYEIDNLRREANRENINKKFKKRKL